MHVNEPELFSILAAGLPGLTPLPDAPELRPGSTPPAIPLGRFQHGHIASWHEVLEIATLPGYGHAWILVPLRSGRVALAWREALTRRHQVAADAWGERALPVIAALLTGREDGHRA